MLYCAVLDIHSHCLSKLIVVVKLKSSIFFCMLSVGNFSREFNPVMETVSNFSVLFSFSHFCVSIIAVVNGI